MGITTSQPARQALKRASNRFFILFISSLMRMFPNVIAYFLFVHLSEKKLRALHLAVTGVIVGFKEPVSVTSGALLHPMNALTARKKDQHLASIFHQGIFVAICVGTLNMLIFSQGQRVVALNVSSEDVRDQAGVFFTHYLKTFGPEFFPLMVCTQQFSVGAQRPWIELLSNVVSSSILVGMVGLMVGVLNLGADGLAYAFSVRYASVSITVVISLLAVMHHRISFSSTSFRLPTSFSTRQTAFEYYFSDAKQIVTEGLPNMLSLGSELSAFAFRGLFLIPRISENHDREKALLAAQGVLVQVLLLMRVAFGNSGCFAAASLVGYEKNEDPENAKRLGNSIIAVAVLVNIIAAGLFCGISYQVSGFVLDANAEEDKLAFDILDDPGVWLMMTLSVAILNVAYTLEGALRGCNKPRPASFASFLGYWPLGTTLSWLLGVYFQGELKGIYGGMSIGMTAYLLMTTRQWHQQCKRSFTESSGVRGHRVFPQVEHELQKPIEVTEGVWPDEQGCAPK